MHVVRSSHVVLHLTAPPGVSHTLLHLGEGVLIVALSGALLAVLIPNVIYAVDPDSVSHATAVRAGKRALLISAAVAALGGLLILFWAI